LVAQFDPGAFKNIHAALCLIWLPKNRQKPQSSTVGTEFVSRLILKTAENLELLTNGTE
jgi:hypothetical protein